MKYFVQRTFVAMFSTRGAGGAAKVDTLPRAGSSTNDRFPSPRQPPLYRVLVNGWE
jgi:hypothetical protein